MKLSNPIRLLVFCVFFIFFGHGYQYLYWDAPWRVLVWDQKLVEPFVIRFLGISWEEYASQIETSHYIRSISYWTGALMLLSAVFSLLLLKWQKWWLYLPIYLSSFLLFAHTYLEMRDQFYILGHLLEYSLQILLPIVLIFLLRKKITELQLILGLKVLVIVCFAAHGLYAIGFYPVPGHYIDMLISGIGVNEDIARWILKVVGCLDLFLVPLILFKPMAKWALWYAILWGVITALARVVANFYGSFPMESLHQHTYQMVFRLPHGLVPLAIWMMIKKTTDSPQTQTV